MIDYIFFKFQLNQMSPKSMNVVFQILEFAIQKGLAAELVARLPFIHV
jgi:hypothetical protein